MSNVNSITQLIPDLKNGNAEAQQQVWERYVRQLAGNARGRLGDLNDGVKHEEIAAEVFASLCRGIEGGRFPKLHDRNDLWQILLMLSKNKVADEARRRMRRPEVLECDLASPQMEFEGPGMTQFGDGEPTPEFIALVAEQYKRAMRLLDDDELRFVARLKMECYSEAEMAEKTGLTLRTLQRRLQLIRRTWQSVANDV